MIAPYTGDTTALRRIFGGFPTGVVALSAVGDDGHPIVMVASTFAVGVSQDPPLVVFAAQHSSSTWPDLARAHRLGVSVLGAEMAGRCRQLSSKNRAKRLADIPVSILDSGAVLLPDGTAWFECEVTAAHRAGDHDLVVMQVLGFGEKLDADPLVWHRSTFVGLAT
ncbi:flavin reductase family protein [Gordonia sp. DT219]|uniref:flavin reductase family protein n=1 Tax=Gordonia sp. DT219 TaxID=3416658 RepID=UPI003CF061E7